MIFSVSPPPSDEAPELGVPADVVDLVEFRGARELAAAQATIQRLEHENATLRATDRLAVWPRASVERTSKHDYACGLMHPRVVVDAHLDRVTCAVCGEALPAIDVLRAMARRELQFACHDQHLRQEQAALEKVVANLKAEVGKLKSAARKLRAIYECQTCGTTWPRGGARACPTCQRQVPAPPSRPRRPRQPRPKGAPVLISVPRQEE